MLTNTPARAGFAVDSTILPSVAAIASPPPSTNSPESKPAISSSIEYALISIANLPPSPSIHERSM